MAKKRKKGSSVKGLILVLVVVGIILTIVLWNVFQDNMTVTVAVYSQEKVLDGADVSIDGQLRKTKEDGSAVFSLRVEEGDTLEVVSKFQDLKKTKKLVMHGFRMQTKHAHCDILLDN